MFGDKVTRELTRELSRLVILSETKISLIGRKFFVSLRMTSIISKCLQRGFQGGIPTLKPSLCAHFTI